MDTGIGQPMVRREDARLLTGRGSYCDDVTMDGQVYGYAVRSPHAHAKLVSIDVAAALKAPGVLAVLTADDYLGDGMKPLAHPAVQAAPEDIKIPGLTLNGGPAVERAQMPLVRDKVRHIGEAVAFVVAETLAQAKDAGERVEATYEPLPAVVRGIDALADGAPQIWDDVPGNIVFDHHVGDKAATDAAFAKAAHVVEQEFVSNRVVNAQMEPRGALGVYDPKTGRYTLYAGTQGVHMIKRRINDTLNVADGDVRIVTRDVGGGFGPRGGLYSEYILSMWASKRVGRPVKWLSERSEAFVSDSQARDLTTRGALALDENGKFLGLRITLYSNVGGNTVSYVPATNGTRIATTLYDIPALDLRALGITTNTLPSIHYRGAGRPQAMQVMEGLIDLAADKAGIDRIELRRRNLIRPDQFPYKTQGGLTYDCGEFEANMDRTMALSDWAGFAARRADARKRGKLRGIGLANYIETPVGIPIERAHVAVRPDGHVNVMIGTQSTGQGHETSFPQVIATWLGVPADCVNIVTGDSDLIPEGGGTHSDRSIRLGGFVMVKASEQIIEKGKKIAAHLLEAAEADVAFAEGTFTVVGTDRTIGLFDVAKAAAGDAVPEELRGPLDGDHKFVGRIPAYPNGCAVCEVEIDPDTGVVTIDRYTTVDDVGRVVNPLIVDGQVHGGIVQGAGQALMEHAIYDPASGQLLAGSFMDYAMPRADVMPSFTVECNEVITQGNPLGVKGGGEAGTTGALAAIMGAVLDALKPLGITRFDMPASPQRVWQAIQEARAA